MCVYIYIDIGTDILIHFSISTFNYMLYIHTYIHIYIHVYI